MKTLQLFNGRGQFHKKVGQTGHIYIAAYSVADAVRLAAELGFFNVTTNEIREYFGKNCWGNSMKDVTPERGIWITPKGAPCGTKPQRIS